MTEFNIASPKPAMIRHGGAVKLITELTGAELAAEMSPAQRAKLSGAIARSSPQAMAQTKLQVVAHAVEHDPRCKGKAALALTYLADDDMAAISGPGIVKLLQRAPAADAKDASALFAQMRSHHAQNDPAAGDTNHGWDKVVAEVRERRN